MSSDGRSVLTSFWKILISFSTKCFWGKTVIPLMNIVDVLVIEAERVEIQHYFFFAVIKLSTASKQFKHLVVSNNPSGSNICYVLYKKKRWININAKCNFYKANEKSQLCCWAYWFWLHQLQPNLRKPNLKQKWRDCHPLRMARFYQPISGSDNFTYMNYCEFYCALLYRIIRGRSLYLERMQWCETYTSS